MNRLNRFIIILITIFFIPLFVNANQCNMEDIDIKSIVLKDKSENVEELSDIFIDHHKINIDLKMYEVGDYVEYKIKVKNNSNENYYIDDNLLELDNKYLKYELSTDDNSNTIKVGKEKNVILKIVYVNEIESEQFRSGKYANNIETIIKMSSREKIIEVLTNPNTGQGKIFYFILFILVIFMLFFKKKKSSLLLLSIFLLPIGTYAICKYEIQINSSVIIEKAKPNYCTFDGELVPGAEYVNGQYTYQYMRESGSGDYWNYMSEDGWGVRLTDKNSTDDVITPLCTYINDKPIVSMYNMFSRSKAKNIDMSSFNTTNVINMGYMFNGSLVTSLDFSSFDTSNVINMNSMFYESRNLIDLDLRYFDTSNLTELYSIFYDMPFINNINIDNWDLSNMQYTPYLLNQTVAVKNISAYYLKLPKDSSYIFSNGTSLEKIEGTKSWDMSKVENTNYMFSGDSSLKEIDLSGLDTSKLITMENMFYNDSNILTINLNNIDVSHVTSMNSMFSGCYSLKELYMQGLDFASLNSRFLISIMGISNKPYLTTLDLSNTKYYGDLSYGFQAYNMESLKEIKLLNVDTSSVTNMSRLFYNSPFLEKIDISDFDTSNVTDMSFMFEQCTRLNNLTIGNINTHNVENMKHMFGACQSLKELDLSYLDVTNLKNFDEMFLNSANFEKINLSNFVSSNTQSFRYIVSGVSHLKELIIDNWVISDVNVGDSSLGNDYGTIIEYVSMKNWVVPKTFSLKNWRGHRVHNVDVSNWNTSNVTDMSYMFCEWYDLTNIIGLNTWDTSNVTSMNKMFQYCYLMPEIDLSGFDYSKVQDISFIFEADSSLKKVNMGNFNALSLEDASYMFYSMPVIEEIIFDSISTPKLKNVAFMFSSLPKLKSLDLRGMNTNLVIDFSNMFINVPLLEYLDLSTFETNDSQNMDSMFSTCHSLTYAYARTQEDADRFNASTNKPENVHFVVKT